ncbi:MAG: CDP-glycerol glycerophosphotransferase family protein [Lachnospiraceae bacterium]|jgi:CDP-glycerol glycerophosphotransferase|nr:CDP-glycerol glycerophosphotransferase family protein [Lachnospiraceae bacterium]OLA31017.1 MAG: hypothetical protein BHW30_00720 [Firmicutes bacterium CAG_194_44_15]
MSKITKKRLQLYIKRKLAGIKKEYMYRTTKVKDNKILFLTFQGAYTCNPRYICDEILKREKNWDLVWVVDDLSEETRKEFPKEVRLVERNTNKYFKELYSAKVWIDNAFNVTKVSVKKKPEQIYLETMHGSLGIKRIGPQDVPDKRRNKRGFRCGRLTDYIVSNSAFEDEVYRTSFWKKTEILEYGHARNDILFIEDRAFKEEIYKKVYDFYQLKDDVNLALYAPTFRSPELDKEPMEELDFDLLHDALTERFGGEWVILNRAHHRDYKNKGYHTQNANVLDGATYPDIQELMIACQVGITDYSSWIFDYVLTRKKGFVYAPDLKAYDDDRGFYYPLETAPFPLAHDNQEMKQNILSFEEKAYQEAVEAFLVDKGCVEDGHASERIVDKLTEWMEDRP